MPIRFQLQCLNQLMSRLFTENFTCHVMHHTFLQYDHSFRTFKVRDKILTLSGPGGGGGSEAWMAKLTAANQKPLIF